MRRKAFKTVFMKKLILILISIASVQSQAVTLKVTGPCSKKPVLKAQVFADTTKSVGEITQDYFDANGIAYKGNGAGFYGIMDSATGAAAIETVSDTEVRGYGWCFRVNGEVATVAPDQVKPRSQNDVIEWFYGFVTQKDGQWSNEPCKPGYKIKAEQFCK